MRRSGDPMVFAYERFLAGLGRMEAADLVGTWVGESAGAEGWTIELRADGSARWSVEGNVWDLRYACDPGASPPTFDLEGFASGPLNGRTLFGIVASGADGRLRWRCEPGAPGVAPRRIRPDAFPPEDTHVLRRRE
jgi:hypothetical protein